LLEDFHLHHWSRELHRRLHGMRVRAVETAGHTRFRLRWAGPGGDLLFLLAPQFPACLPVRPGDPAAAADWLPCAPADAVVAGATLVSVEKVPDDRILFFSLAAGETVFTLRAEIRPIAPALYLCGPDDSVLFSLGALRRRLIRPPEKHLREERPGRIEPAPDALVPFLAALPRDQWRSGLARSVRRLSPTLVEEALVRAGGEASAEAVAASVAGVCSLAYQPADRNFLYSRVPWPERDFPLDPAREIRLASFPLASAAGWECRESADLGPLLALWLDYTRRQQAFTQARGELLRRLGERSRRAEGKIHSLQEQLAAAEDADRLKQFGEIILAGLSRFGADFRGESLTAPDLYDPEQADVRIPLDPLKTLPENAESYFRRHRKARQAARAVPERLAAARRRLAETGSRIAAVDAARSPAELEAASLPALDDRRSKPAPGPAALPADRRLRRFQSRGGRTILVGRSAADNDHLSFRVGRPNDIWCHAADYSGSHVVLQWGRKEDPPLEELRETAAVAAWYSGARQEPHADVRWTRCKFVQKIKGVPGRVRLQQSRTIRVAPALPKIPEVE
jgi:predicted ribosome quality control (RQC) complex YloA/Tae2 family protein